jgi:hypothetical protein
MDKPRRKLSRRPGALPTPLRWWQSLHCTKTSQNAVDLYIRQKCQFALLDGMTRDGAKLERHN